MAVGRCEAGTVRQCGGVVMCAAFGLTLLAAATVPVRAHHSFSAEFDINKPIKLTGTITEVRWSNPHSWIYIDVKDETGKVVNWAFEMQPANALYRRGWRPADVTAGTMVTIEGWASRSGNPTANTNTIVLSDGRRLFAGAPPSEGGPR
jgi:DNA/RNA endonuclease YhcR with UshA esterase domain